MLSPPNPERNGVIRTELQPELKEIFDPIGKAVVEMTLPGVEPMEVRHPHLILTSSSPDPYHPHLILTILT